VYPRAGRSLLEGTFEWAALVGHRGVGRAPCALKQDAVSFGFFAGFKRDFPICLRGPPGLSPTHGTEAGRRKKIGGSHRGKMVISPVCFD
jgi:hypothetical protein